MKNKNIKSKLTKVLQSCMLTLMILIPTACSSLELQKEKVDLTELAALEDRVRADSLDSEALKKLSILLVKGRQNEKANVYLSKALRILPNDDALLFNQGLNYEFLNDTISAMKFYERYMEVSTESPYRKLMEGRYLYLYRNKIYKDIQYRIVFESNLNIQSIPENTLAVFPLGYHGVDKKYEPLSRGLSEMISIDLSKVNRLTVLERIRLKAIVDELEYGKSSTVDQSSAARIGKILSARLLYNGFFSIVDDDNLKIEMNSFDITNTQKEIWLNKKGKLRDLFAMEKELVFGIIDELGVKLTQEEKEQIELIPTENIYAFLEYSRGLEMEDNGDYDAAAVFFLNASQIDPDFKEASLKSDLSSSISGGSGNRDEFFERSNVISGGDSFAETIKEDIIINRLKIVGESIRSTFDQGMERREAPQEAATEIKLPSPPARPR